ncbi:MAG: hypothetical protein II794_04390 [Oscillospiraceae bacterium]|nr:hypothetical protein [Oscillospiraceae bacterium]
MAENNNDNGVMELIDLLHSMISEAWCLPIGAERCVIDKNQALDYLEEIKAKLPVELSDARRLVAARAEFIGNAKREAESVRKVAEDKARQLVDETEVIRIAKEKALGITQTAESRSNELRTVANQYADDTLMRTEEAISAALEEIRQARTRFRSVAGTQTQNPMQNIVPDQE